MPRLLSRALLVLGGTVAATATAWLITSASASADMSADILPTLPGAPGISAPELSGPDVTAVTKAVSDTLTSVVAHPAAVSPLPSQATAKVRGVTGELRTAVGRLRDHVRAGKDLVAPPLTVLPSTPQVVPTPAGQSGPAVGRSPARRLPTSVATIVAPVPTGPSMAQRSGDRPSPRPSTHAVTPSAVPAQWVPAPVPSAPAGGGAGAPGPGGLGLGDTSGAFPVPDLDLAHDVPVTNPLGTGTTGRQPGSTPD